MLEPLPKPHLPGDETETPDDIAPWAELPSIEEVGRRAARGVFTTLAARVAVQLLNVGALMVLARMLRPEDFGLVGIVVSTIGLGDLLRDFGLSAATMRARTLTPGQINTFFWINLALGALVAGVCAAFAPWVGRWYHDERLTALTLLLSCNFVISGFAAQHLALVRRQLRFDVLARNTLFSSTAGQLVALSCAFLGLGYWSLAAGAMTSNFVSAAMASASSGWRPQRPQFDPAVKPMLHFGGYLGVFGVLSYAAQNLHNVAIGAIWGSVAAGLYNRALTLLRTLVGYVQGPFQQVGPPALARIHHNPEAFRRYYLEVLSAMLAAGAPLGAFIALEGVTISNLMLGRQWTLAGEILRWLALGTPAQLLCFTSGWLYLANGNSKGMMRWGVGSWSFVIAALLASAHFGIMQMAAVYSLSMWLLLVPCLYFALRGTSVRLRDVAKYVWKPICAAGLAIAPCVALSNSFAQAMPPLMRLPVQGGVFGAGYLFWLVVVLREPLSPRVWLARLRGAAGASSSAAGVA